MLCLFESLDPFRNQTHVKGVADGYHPGDDGTIMRIVRDILDEPAVDLELRDRSARQGCQRGEAGPEIVEGDPYPAGYEIV